MAAGIEAYPWFLNKPLEVKVGGQAVTTRITVHEWVDHWKPLLEHIWHLHQAHPQRLMVAIGGPPGSGKSVLAEQISWMASKNFLPDCTAIALPMDGFHYPNEYLRTHLHHLPDGDLVPLAELKGAPETFDVGELKQHLHLLRARAEEVFWPGYSRVEHEPIPHEYRIPAAVNLVIVEGNYLLLDHGVYAGIAGLFDFKIYLETPAAGIISNLVQRHMAGGKTLEDAKAWLKRIDLPNARIVESTRHNADLTIERNTVDDIIALHWRHHAPAATEPRRRENAE